LVENNCPQMSSPEMDEFHIFGKFQKKLEISRKNEYFKKTWKILQLMGISSFFEIPLAGNFFEKNPNYIWNSFLREHYYLRFSVDFLYIIIITIVELLFFRLYFLCYINNRER